MTPIGRLAAAGARRMGAAHASPRGVVPPPRMARARAEEGRGEARSDGPGQGRAAGSCAALPADVSREALLRLVERAAPRLGLGDKALRALRLVAGTCRWADFVSDTTDPICFRQARRMAEELGVSPGYWRKLEAQLERAGLIERATCENGQRGRLGGGVVAGLSLGPLVAGLDRWRALAAELEAERAALEEGRARARIARRAARRAVEGLAEDHPARVAYGALRGAGFRPSARLRDAGAIAEHLAALEAVREAGRRAREAAGERVDEATAGTGGSGPDDMNWSGAARPQERCHTKRTKDPQTGICSRAETEARRDAARPEGRMADGGGGREEGRGGDAAPDDADSGSDGPSGPGPGTRPPSPGLGSRIHPDVLQRLSPRALRDLGSEELRLYVDHLRPGPDGSAAPPTLGAIEDAARSRRAELGVTAQLWDEVERSLGWFDALLALIVVDANHRHPTAPVRNAPGLLRDLARRGRAGTLDLGASVQAIWRREEGVWAGGAA